MAEKVRADGKLAPIYAPEFSLYVDVGLQRLTVNIA